MCLIYPRLSGKPVLLPVYWVIRAVDIILHRNNKITEVAKTYDNVDIDYAKEVIDLKKELGL